ncbi:class I SAM-dependent methyltransferase [Dyadobacter tibetensis]|uniref:class I SAM-dependent methyltransferase n=1 Tax=Dyadobacter tibetensis TaxID=1211851 RepID=UPI000470E108|nr:class I SAM-dependent methyltransferase [Dyadobacter tibetensis]
MIDNPEEYQRMQEVEQKLWWYRSLHRRVLSQIETYIQKEKKTIRILDAACGTGGLLLALKNAGYEHASGFDLSTTAVQLAQESGLDVSVGDLRQSTQYRAGLSFDVICCNDALYFLTDEEIIAFLKNMKERLNPGGLLLINIHAFEAFAGSHDVAIGSTRRYTWKDFHEYTQQAGLAVLYRTYWPFLLSLPILMVRQWQKYRLHISADLSEPPVSDVSYPGDIVNASLWKVMQLENNLLNRAPFGSSLFMVLQPSRVVFLN